MYNLFLFYIAVLDSNKPIKCIDENKSKDKIDTSKEECDYQQNTDVLTTCG